jgi:hypothetical protein
VLQGAAGHFHNLCRHYYIPFHWWKDECHKLILAWKRVVQFFNALCTQENVNILEASLHWVMTCIVHCQATLCQKICLYVVWSDISWTELISPLISVVPFIVGIFFLSLCSKPSNCTTIWSILCSALFEYISSESFYESCLFFKKVIAYNIV